MGMYCKTCEYNLSHCVSRDCPECGQSYDPDQPKSFLKKPRSKFLYARPSLRFALIASLIALSWHINLPAAVNAYVFNADERNGRHSGFHYLQTLRSQLHLYAHQHGGYPTLQELQSWDILLQKTDAQGNTGIGPLHIYGPYLQQPMPNRYTDSTTVVSPANATLNDGWVYDEATHTLLFIADQDFVDEWGLDPAEVFVPPTQYKTRQHRHKR